MKASASTLAVGLLLSVALPAGVVRASDPAEQVMLARANYWRAQHRLDLAGQILSKILEANPGQPDALYQQGVLAKEQGDNGTAQQYFDRLRQLAPADQRAAELARSLAQPDVTRQAAPSTQAALPAPTVPALQAAFSPQAALPTQAAPTADTAPSSPPPAAPQAKPATVAANSPSSSSPTKMGPVAYTHPNPPAEPVKPATVAAGDPVAIRVSAASSTQAPPFVAASADSDDLTPARHSAPARQTPAPAPHYVSTASLTNAAPAAQAATSLPAPTATDVDPIPATASAARPAGSTDLGITAKAVQVAQVELEPPPPVAGYQPLGMLKPYSPDDTLEMYIDRNLQQLEAQANPTLIAGFGFLSHTGTEGTEHLTEIGGPVQLSFSPWYTGTATLAVLPVYIDAGSLSSSDLNTFGINPLLSAAGLSQISPGGQNATGVGLLGSYTWGDFSGQFGTSPLGFPVTNYVGNVAYMPKLLDGNLTLRIEGLRQPVNETVLSFAGTHANFTTLNQVAPGASSLFGTNTLWGGVVKTGGHFAAFYDDQFFGSYGGFGLAWLNGTNVAENSTLDAQLGAYIRPWKTDDWAIRVGISGYYATFDKNLSGFTFGQGGYFSPQNFESLGFPVEYTGRNGPWTWLAAATLGIQAFNADRSAIFPNNRSAQLALETLSPSTAFNSGISGGIGLGVNLKGQIEYAVNPTLSIGAAGSFNNSNDYDEGIVQVYLRKTFDWFAPFASKNDPRSIAQRDMPMGRM
jgi:hypothetical protein